MSTTFWKALKLSPALLGASLLLASSAYAKESVSAQTAEVNQAQAEAAVEVPVGPLAELSKSSVEVEPLAKLSDPTVEETPVSQEIPVEPIAALPETSIEEISVSQEMPSQTRTPVPAENILAEQVQTPGEANVNSTDVLEQLQIYGEEGTADSQEQVTSVSQLSDVSPGDWAFEALRSLVERYGCIAGYPDGTYRGNRALTRYEFAAGLNACLTQIERLIAASSEGFVTREDLETLQRLVQEFQAELATIGTRVDNLEGRVAFLEDNQFSTTTKLIGEVIFAVSDLFGGEDLDTNFDGIAGGPGDVDNPDNTVFQDRVRLNFDTSFTGRDLLRTRLEAGNVGLFPDLAQNSVTREGRFGFESDTGNDVEIDDLFYRFPLANIANVYLFANGAGFDDFVPLLNPLEASGIGSISRFGRYSPIYRIGQQNAGIGVNIAPNGPLTLSLGYLTNEAADPSEGAGLFDGNYSALAQLTFKPFDALQIAATYHHVYNSNNLPTGTGSNPSQLLLVPAVRDITALVGNAYGLQASFALTPGIIISGWASYMNGIVLGRGNADVWSYAGTLAIRDIGREGSLLGVVVGMEPKLTGSDASLLGAIRDLPPGQRKNSDTGLHIEAFYRYQLNDNISITPGVIWLTAPGHNDDNDDIFVGTVRTTFRF